jgi:predicted permease
VTTPDFRRYVREHLPALPIRPEREIEIVEELALQLEAAYETARRNGATHAAAVLEARAEVPDWHSLARTLTTIEAANAHSGRSSLPPPRRGALRGVSQDLRLAWRGLVRAPGFAFTAVATLAIALGLGAAAFALIDGILLAPLPYPSADRLVLVRATVPPEGRETVELTLPDITDLAATDAFAGLAAVVPFAGTTTLTDPPSRLEGFEVTPALFATLGIEPVTGRVFTAADSDPSNPPVAIVSHGFWQRLGAPGDIVGRTIAINEVARTIVGVAPAGFQIDVLPHPADVFLPITRAHPLAANRGLRTFRGIARLADGVSVEQATAVAATLGARLAQAHPDTNRGRSFVVRPLHDEVVGSVRPQLWLVASLVSLVLLVAAVNFAGLLLTRTVGRLRDVAVRVALGASHWRMARESMAEGVMMAGAGAALGLILGAAALEVVKAAPGLMLPRLSHVAVDQRTFIALGMVAVAIAAAAGVIPLVVLRQIGSTASLRTGHETASRPALRLRSLLVVGQTAFAFLLLSTAALLATNLRAILSQPLGFETRQIVTLRIAVPESRYPTREDTTRFYTELTDALRAQPSIVAAGVTSNLPLAGSTGSTLSVQGRDDVPLAMRPTVGWNWSSPGYFAAMGMPILQGRDFEAADVARSPHVTVINETLARLHFNGEEPIGKRVYFGGFGPSGPPEWHEVIGVVGDVRHRQIESAPDPRAYDLFGQHWGRTISLAVRTSAEPTQVATLVRQILSARDPRLAVFQVRTAADLVAGAVSTRRLLLGLVTVFAIAGLTVALLGLYGTVSYMVALRTREIGVRLALGAPARSIRGAVLARGLGMVAAGIGLGAAGALLLRPVIDAQLTGMTTNAAALSGAAVALILAALGACLLPAGRAMRINPVDALKD